MNIYDEMLRIYAADGNKLKLQNAKYEVAQQITLAGLRRGGFFDNPRNLDFWSKEYFLQQADKIIYM